MLKVLNVKVLVGAFNQEKALVGAFSVIVLFKTDGLFAPPLHPALPPSPGRRAPGTPPTWAWAAAASSSRRGAAPTSAASRPHFRWRGKPVPRFRRTVAWCGRCSGDCRTPENCGNIATINLVLSQHKSGILLPRGWQRGNSFILNNA